MKFSIFIISLLFSAQTFAQTQTHGFVQCLFETYNGQWDIGFSAYINGSIDLEVGDKTSLMSIWWKNPQGAEFNETALCAHVKNTFSDGTLEIGSTVHNGQLFEDLDGSFTCNWQGVGIEESLRKTKRLARGENLTIQFDRIAPLKSKVRVVNYLPTKSEIKKLDPYVTEDICMRFHP